MVVWLLIATKHPRKTDMTVEKEQFEEVYPIKYGDFPLHVHCHDKCKRENSQVNKTILSCHDCWEKILQEQSQVKSVHQ